MNKDDLIEVSVGALTYKHSLVQPFVYNINGRCLTILPGQTSNPRMSVFLRSYKITSLANIISVTPENQSIATEVSRMDVNGPRKYTSNSGAMVNGSVSEGTYTMPFVPFSDSLIDKLLALTRIPYRRVLLIDVKVLKYQNQLKIGTYPSSMFYFER